MKTRNKSNSSAVKISNLDDSYLAHGDFVYRHTPVPVFVKAKGSILTDNKGYNYLDAEAANGTVGLGFDNTIISEAVKKAKKLPSIPSFCETQIRKKVAQRIVRKIKKITGQSGRVAFDLGGAEAVELALKVVRSNQKKSQFVVFEGAYHGRSIYTSQLSASHRYRSLMGDWRIPVVRLPYPDLEQSDYFQNKNSYISYLLNNIKRLVETELGGVTAQNREPDIAAFIFEPLLNAGGIVKPDPNYLEGVVKIFKKLGALIVVDEIFCGFYRTGPMFGFEHYKFIPDIVIISKAITNGIVPLSCVWARDPLMSPEKFPPGTHSATFINNPLALAVADTVLDRYNSWSNREEEIKKLESSLKSAIDKIVHSSKLALSGYALGGVGRIVLKKNIAGKILDIARTIAYDNPVKGVHGLILASTNMAPNIVTLNPPLKIKQKELIILDKLLVRTFEKADRLSS